MKAHIAELLESRRLFAVWDGGGDGTRWMDPLNWDTNTLPTADENVSINGGSYNVFVDSGSAECFSLSVYGGKLTINGGRLTVATGSPKSVRLESGELNIRSSLRIDGFSTFEWAGGTISGTGLMTLGNTLRVETSAVPKRLLTTLQITAGGTGFPVVPINGTIYLGDDTTQGIIHAHASGVYVESGAFLSGGTAGGVVRVPGTFVKLGSGTFVVGIGVRFDNFGDVGVDAGLLDIHQINAVSDPVYGGGTPRSFNLASGNLALRTGTLYDAKFQVTNTTATVQIVEAGDLDVWGVSLYKNIEWHGGSISQSVASGAGLLIQGDVRLTGTDVRPGTTVSILSTGYLHLSETERPTIGGTLYNNGRLDVKTLVLHDVAGNAGTMTIGGTWTVGPGLQVIGPASGVAFIQNNNTVNIATTASEPVVLGSDVQFINSGTIALQSGALLLARFPGLTDGVLPAGTWSLEGGSADFGRDVLDSSAIIKFMVAGASMPRLESLNTNRGQIHMYAGSAFAIAPQAGLFTNLGQIQLYSSSTLLIAPQGGDMISQGPIVVNDAAGLSVAGRLVNSSTLQNFSTVPIAVTSFEQSTTGSVVTKANSSSIVATGAATLAGKLTYTMPAAPNLAAQLDVIQAQTVLGIFTTVSGTSTTNGRLYRTSYSNTVMRVVVAPVAPTTPDLAAAGDSGRSSTDNVTKLTQLSFSTVLADPGTAELLIDGISFGGPTVDSIWSLNLSALPDGVHPIVVRLTDAEGDTRNSATLSITIDRVAPVFQTLSFDLTSAIQLTPVFNETLGALGTTLPTIVSDGGMTIASLITSSFAYRTQLTSIPDDRYTASVESTAQDIAGNQTQFLGFAEFWYLAGDANRDRKVDFDDLLIIAQNYNRTGMTFSQGNVNFDAQGRVDFNDLLLMAQQYGKVLLFPLLSGETSAKKTFTRIATDVNK